MIQNVDRRKMLSKETKRSLVSYPMETTLMNNLCVRVTSDFPITNHVLFMPLP